MSPSLLKSTKVRLLLGLIITAAAGGLIIGFGTSLFSTATILDLIRENKQLQTALTNLTTEQQIGYAKVVSQETRADGSIHTRLLFVQTDRSDPTIRILEREYEIEGDIIYLDALIVKFNNEAVAGGRERALYLWRRVYGENQAPAQGFPIEVEGEAPSRYADISARLKLDQRQFFWNEIWALSNDPNRLADAGITAIYGNVVYKKVQPGLIYVFKINNAGALYPEVIPDL